MKTSIILALLLVIASACTNDSDATSGNGFESLCYFINWKNIFKLVQL
jgi:hypothetical protein